MPIQPTYPGVYVEEIKSGVRTITGVSTSITAFIGRALRGPVDEPITINSYGDFERIFGGLWLNSTLGYALRDFYLNGGSQAIIVRLTHSKLKQAEGQAPAEGQTPGETEPTAKKAQLNVNGLNLEAANEGSWGNALKVRIDIDIKVRGDAESEKLFNITVLDQKTGQLEVFRNVSVLPNHPRQVDKVLLNESYLVRFRDESLPTNRPAAHADPTPDKKLWGDNDTNTKVEPNSGADGDYLDVNDFTGLNKEANKQGLYALNKADLFNILCIPPYKENGNIDYHPLVDSAAEFCQTRRAFFIIDPPSGWTDKDKAKAGIQNDLGEPTSYAAVFFPRIKQPNPLRENQIEEFVPCGAIAGVFARTDVQRGVWKAPAGTEATLTGVPQLSVPLTDPDNGELNPLGINCLRTLPAYGRVIWGSRTRNGDDRLTDEWKYIPVRRFALFLEESLYRGTQWVVFEPNDEPLWAQIRLNLGAFMHTLFLQGAFQGRKPEDAYFVKCDKETTIQNDINLGIVNIIVGFAPLKPAEFVILKIQQIAGQIAV
ncbi:phage tail sheath family protein [Nostoc sp. 'Peltigera malacea cyanobiont' DB3992]|uniref:phage tail sheath family protein n=1 Tax=Nostoc sp. 'Peltigera malacea cyanobiont' DB3992 TaxID=1206980 RepID=UPI000C04B93B|nr:phage tail sheath C-terminal domain-containing protein [Nostoc sp. 'Peltigera malacea cyanobiont' DB3992]PHM08298.1 phage tail protein [Nostoc sp. 'Peltigera malacea cyanobiont' DB3992]